MDQGKGMWKNLESLSSCAPPTSLQASQVDWPLAQHIQAGKGDWPYRNLRPQPLHFADGVTESREGRMAKASQLMSASFLPRSAVTQDSSQPQLS